MEIVNGGESPQNTLWGFKSYLIGSIDMCPDGGKKWRDWITPELNRRGVIVLDPLNKPMLKASESDDHREERSVWKHSGDFDRFAKTIKSIRNTDLGFVDRSDFIIMCLNLEIPSCGSYEELFWANRMKKPLLIWCPQGKRNVPDWLFAVIHHNFFFDSLTEVLAYLDYINSGAEDDPNSRWLFIDYKKLYDQIGCK